MLIPIRIDRTSKPPLGVPLRSDGHLSVHGLVGCWGLNEAAGKICNNPYGLALTINAGSWDSDGVKLVASSSQYLSAIANAKVSGLEAITIITGAQTFPSFSAAVASNGNLGGTSTEWFLKTTTGAPIKQRFVWGLSGGNITVTDTDAMDSAYHIWAGVGSGATASLYRDGKFVASGSGSGTANVASGSIAIGRQASGADYSGTVKFLLIYNRALPPAEIASLSANPWQIYEPEVVWVELGASGGITFNPAWAAGCNQIMGGDCYVS